MRMKAAIKLLILVIIISIAASIFQIGIRVSAERKENTMDIAADYDTFKTFANSYGETVYESINELSRNGITSVAVPEQSIQDVVDSGEATQYVGSDILSGNIPDQFLQDISFPKFKDTIKPFYTVVITKDKDLANRMANNLPSDTNLIESSKKSAQFYVVVVHSDPIDAANFGIGFDDEVIANFKKMGLNIILRPRYAPGNRNLETLENTMKKFDIHAVMFYGNMIYGIGGEGTKALANFFKQNHVVTYIIELPVQKGIYNQEGLPQLIKATNYYVARVYSIYPAEQLKLTPPQIFNRWSRSISDRNIRVIYVKPIVDYGKGYQDNMIVNDYYVNKLHNLWQRKGMKFGLPHPIPEVNIHSSLILLIMLGIIALFMLYMDVLFDLKEKYILVWFVILSILSTAIIYLSKNTSEKLFALSAAVLITGIVSLPILQYIKKIYGKEKLSITKVLGKGIMLSVVLFSISLIGALWISALLSPSTYLLNLDMFRGVKVLYLFPFIFLIINYLYVFGADFNNNHIPKRTYNIFTEIKNAWNITVKWGHIIILIALAGIFLVYLLRSGNTGVSISSIELKLRALLEQTIVARPRFKEFLIGYPALFLTLLAGFLMRKKWIIIFSAFAVMGSVSIVDTFSHLRETFLISLYRGLWGIDIGIVVSVLLVLILYVPVKHYLKNA
jgi:hypothetical protein